MFNWFSSRISPQHNAPREATLRPRLPKGDRIYAIGDIHGRRDLLDQLLGMIEADLEGWTGDSRLVFLGDYIDRGPNSQGVIERLMQPLPCNLAPIFLLGNHEFTLLKFLTQASAGRSWLTYGGLNFLLSYGIPFKGDLMNTESMAALQQDVIKAFPAAQRQFLEAMPTFFSCGDYYFVHAGIRPEIPLDQQSDNDRLWIREEFLQSNAAHEKFIIHGHSITPEVDQQAYRMGIDTGAYASGHLTALVLEDETRRIIQT